MKMLNNKVVAFMVTIILLLCGCSSHHLDEIEDPNPPDTTVYQPHVGLDPTVPLFKDYDKIVGYSLWRDVKIPDTNLTGVGYCYDYWEEHKHEASTFEELMALCEVPQELLAAMSTRNLILTCFMHPYLNLFYSYTNNYIGIMVAMGANCWQELMKRETGTSQLLDLYCELTYPTSSISSAQSAGLCYLDYKEKAAENPHKLSGLALTLMTAVDGNVFTSEQLKCLAGEFFRKIDNLYAADKGRYTYNTTIRFPFLLGAFIAYHYDQSLTPYELSLLYDFTGFQGMPGFDEETGRRFTPQNVSSALNIVTRSLERIEQGGLQISN